VLAYRRGDEEERAFWQRCLQEGDQRDEDLPHALHLLAKHRAIEDTIKRARHYGEMAQDALGIFPDGNIKQALSDLIDFCIERAH
jgi:octaprenyl-diphosphate synthase